MSYRTQKEQAKYETSFNKGKRTHPQLYRRHLKQVLNQARTMHVTQYRLVCSVWFLSFVMV